MSYIEMTGKTEEDAVSRALAQLGLDRDDVSVEILERAKSGFLGIGSTPAKVRVTYGQEEESAAAPEMAPAAPKERPAPVMQRKPERRAPVTAREAPAAPAMAHIETAAPGEECSDEKAVQIRAFLSGLLEKLEVESQIHVYLPEKGRYQVILEGPAMGQLIGRRGETLDAIQQLTSYAVNRAEGGRVRVQLDAENYRKKREESLEHLAHKVAAKVVKYRRSVTLEPMNAYERHIIHTALQEEPNVTTGSIGTEPNRRVVVSYER